MVPAVSIVEDDLYAGAEDMTVRACVEQLLPLLLVEGLVLHTSLRHEIQEVWIRDLHFHGLFFVIEYLVNEFTSCTYVILSLWIMEYGMDA